MIGRIAGIVWTATALFFVASIASALVIAVVRKARARSLRLFRDLPNRRLGVPTSDERYSA